MWRVYNPLLSNWKSKGKNFVKWLKKCLAGCFIIKKEKEGVLNILMNYHPCQIYNKHTWHFLEDNIFASALVTKTIMYCSSVQITYHLKCYILFCSLAHTREIKHKYDKYHQIGKKGIQILPYGSQNTLRM